MTNGSQTTGPKVDVEITGPKVDVEIPAQDQALGELTGLLGLADKVQHSVSALELRHAKIMLVCAMFAVVTSFLVFATSQFGEPSGSGIGVAPQLAALTFMWAAVVGSWLTLGRMRRAIRAEYRALVEVLGLIREVYGTMELSPLVRAGISIQLSRFDIGPDAQHGALDLFVFGKPAGSFFRWQEQERIRKLREKNQLSLVEQPDRGVREALGR